MKNRPVLENNLALGVVGGCRLEEQRGLHMNQGVFVHNSRCSNAFVVQVPHSLSIFTFPRWYYRNAPY